MSGYLTAERISDAWIQALDKVNSCKGGTATHLMVVVSAPDLGTDPVVTAVVNRALLGIGSPSVFTVANTLFPAALYNDPGFSWSPGLPPDAEATLDSAATELYGAYLEALPALRRVPANRRGTYFSRMISWPGKTTTGINQLQRRIDALRTDHRQGRGTSNASDIAVAGESDGANNPSMVGGMLEEYTVTDTRTQGFPCLIHIDISVRGGALSLLAIYRHWHLITRGYGNLIGLARLQQFLCEQTGYKVGELAIVAGHANAEHSDYSGRSGVNAIMDEINKARADLTLASEVPA